MEKPIYYYTEYRSSVSQNYSIELTYFRNLNVNDMSWNKMRNFFKDKKKSTLTSFFFYIKWLLNKHYLVDEQYEAFIKNNDAYFDFNSRRKTFDLKPLCNYEHIEYFYIRNNARKELKCLYLPYQSELLASYVKRFSDNTEVIKFCYFDTFSHLEEAIGFPLKSKEQVSKEMIEKVYSYMLDKKFQISRERLYDIFSSEEGLIHTIYRNYLNSKVITPLSISDYLSY